jgi:hypothetical protein
MSSFYDDSSLVVIPSGYKTSKIYAEKPTDGSGDLTFTRASGATRVGPDGLIEKVRTNLATYSEDFTNAAWSKYQASVTGNSVVAPDGTTTADTLIDNTANDIHVTYQTLSLTAGENTISVYAKANTLSHACIYVYDGANFFISGIFNLSNGTVSGAGSIVSAGNGWYRISFTTTIASGSGNVYIALSNGSTITYAGTGQSIYVWGYQAETGVATDYIPTTTAAVSVGPVSNVPRLDYLGSSCPRLLLEPQRTNLVTYSEQFDNAAWTKAAVSVTANNITSPDGTQNADLFTTTSASICGAYQLISTGSGTFSFSIFAKKGNNNYLALNAQSSSANNCTAIFDLSDGTLGEYQTKGTTAYVSHKIENFGNDWYRCTMVLTTTTSVYFFPMFAPLKTGNTFTSSGEVNVASGKTLYLWGCQIEAGAYATSYIPTLGASVTRVADAASKTGISSLIGQTEGTLYGEFSNTASPNASRISLSDGSSNNWVFISLENNKVRGFVRANGVTIFSDETTPATSNNKVALAYQSGNIALYINGVQVLTDSSSFTFTLLLSEFGSLVGASNTVDDPIFIKGLAAFPVRLSNAQLAELTTL